MHLDSETCSTQKLTSSIQRFTGWLDQEGYSSFDPYDIWGTSYGLWSRKIYYRNRKLGTPLVAPIVILDPFFPSLRKLFVKKDRFATADAQLLLAFLNLHAVTGEAKYLERAIKLGDEIMGYSVPGYRGPCWGYPFDWQNDRGAVWVKNTPYITCTPYCYEAFLGLFALTGNERYRKIAAGIAEFIYGDLRDTPTSATASAGSYSPNDSSKVVNASAYRAYVLIDAGIRFERKDYADVGQRNLNFVLESQAADGSWLYAIDGSRSFIDNFHTCFNLKNLFKLNRLLNRSDVRDSIRRGYDYYRAHLFHPNGDPKSFAAEPRLQIATLEMYNFAEGITLGALLGDAIPEARADAQRLARRLIDDFQLPTGTFVTRVFRFGLRHTFPFLRWPQAQLYYSLTNLLRAMSPRAQGGPVPPARFSAS